MSGTNNIYINGKNSDRMTVDKMKAMVDCPVVSALVDLAATGYTRVVQIPAGAYVTQVGLFAKTAITSSAGDIDVGDSVVTDRYIDGIATLAVNNIYISGRDGSTSADPVVGHYYSAADYIRVRCIATPITGSVKILVWYTLP